MRQEPKGIPRAICGHIIELRYSSASTQELLRSSTIDFMDDIVVNRGTQFITLTSTSTPSKLARPTRSVNNIEKEQWAGALTGHEAKDRSSSHPC